MEKEDNIPPKPWHKHTQVDTYTHNVKHQERTGELLAIQSLALIPSTSDIRSFCVKQHFCLMSSFSVVREQSL